MSVPTVHTALFPFTLIPLVPRLLLSPCPHISVPLPLRHCAPNVLCARRRIPNLCTILMYIHCSGCCNVVIVLGAEDAQPNAMGTYQMVPGLTKQGRPVYRSSRGGYLYYYPSISSWVIGDDHTSSIVGAVSLGAQPTQCPTEPTAWRVVWRGRLVQRPLKVVCVIAGVVRMACAKGDMSSIDGLWFLLGTGSRPTMLLSLFLPMSSWNRTMVAYRQREGWVLSSVLLPILLAQRDPFGRFSRKQSTETLFGLPCRVEITGNQGIYRQRK